MIQQNTNQIVSNSLKSALPIPSDCPPPLPMPIHSSTLMHTLMKYRNPELLASVELREVQLLSFTFTAHVLCQSICILYVLDTTLQLKAKAFLSLTFERKHLINENGQPCSLLIQNEEFD